MKYSYLITRIIILLMTLITGSCISTNQYKYNADLHKIVIIDNTLSPDERGYIIDACHSWENSTNKFVSFEFVENITPHVSKNNIVIITNVISTDPEIVRVDRERGDDRYTIGLTTLTADGTPEIKFVKNKITDEIMYYPLALHEIGHILHLDHEDCRNCIMNPGIGQGSVDIEQDDLDQFCSIYMCDRPMTPEF